MSPNCTLALVPSVLPGAMLPPSPAAGEAETEMPSRCGWFESSHELVQGMRVIEHSGFDALMFEVPLAWQLAACS